ncbi:hypothetical protein G6F68_011422 [Rhizopus microsporus]|nr:hypothetical protein G6F68_011422 [Rhizopus microsporus]
MGVVLTDEPGADSWPVTAATFILIHKSQDKPAQGKAVLEFFDWAFKNGAKSAETMDYVPLPDSLVRQIETYWSQNLNLLDCSWSALVEQARLYEGPRTRLGAGVCGPTVRTYREHGAVEQARRYGGHPPVIPCADPGSAGVSRIVALTVKPLSERDPGHLCRGRNTAVTKTSFPSRIRRPRRLFPAME